MTQGNTVISMHFQGFNIKQIEPEQCTTKEHFNGSTEVNKWVLRGLSVGVV